MIPIIVADKTGSGAAGNGNFLKGKGHFVFGGLSADYSAEGRSAPIISEVTGAICFP